MIDDRTKTAEKHQHQTIKLEPNYANGEAAPEILAKVYVGTSRYLRGGFAAR